MVAPFECWGAVVQLHRDPRVIWIRLPEVGTHAEYEIDLDRVKTCRDVCDWLSHLIEKNWATPEVLGNVVRALDAAGCMRGLE